MAEVEQNERARDRALEQGSQRGRRSPGRRAFGTPVAAVVAVITVMACLGGIGSTAAQAQGQVVDLTVGVAPPTGPAGTVFEITGVCTVDGVGADRVTVHLFQPVPPSNETWIEATVDDAGAYTASFQSSVGATGTYSVDAACIHEGPIVGEVTTSLTVEDGLAPGHVVEATATRVPGGPPGTFTVDGQCLVGDQVPNEVEASVFKETPAGVTYENIFENTADDEGRFSVLVELPASVVGEVTIDLSCQLDGRPIGHLIFTYLVEDPMVRGSDAAAQPPSAVPVDGQAAFTG